MKIGDAVIITAKDSVYKGCAGKITSSQQGGFVVKFKKPAQDPREVRPEYELLFSQTELALQHEQAVASGT